MNADVERVLAQRERDTLFEAADALRALGRGCAPEYAEWLEQRAAAVDVPDDPAERSATPLSDRLDAARARGGGPT